uniref:Uncharacterized protein n=1 Tax=Xiphophorus couchianus TaxID=32473 RepID=A0A3B5MH68_9TELE
CLLLCGSQIGNSPIGSLRGITEDVNLVCSTSDAVRAVAARDANLLKIRQFFLPFNPGLKQISFYGLIPSSLCTPQGLHNDFCFFLWQNFKEEMAVQPEASQWLSWSLEQVALVLGQRFPNRNIWVVKASRMYLNKFSCYQNFVESNMFGAPEHTAYTADSGAFHQLRSLLTNAMERAKLPPSGGAGGLPPGFSLTLVGFSKGCVVLNQLVYELPGARADPNMAAFVRRISDVRTWVTDREALRELAASGVSVHAHVTPYEVRDPMRAWVGREYGVFIQTLEELGACPSRKLHFQDEPPSIQNHFRVILEF